MTVCIAPTRTLTYPEGGGHLWAYLNWALGLQALGCRVIWLECVNSDQPAETLAINVRRLKHHLATAGLEADVALVPLPGARLPAAVADTCLDVAAAAEADVLLNFVYDLDSSVVTRFKRSGLIDIDPGVLQAWMATGKIEVAAHDVYFTIGERVGGASSDTSPSSPLLWHHTPPPVALDAWRVRPAGPGSPYTTVSHWWEESNWITWGDVAYPNDKRAAFLEYLDLPGHTAVPLELALFLTESEEEEKQLLERHGWTVRVARDVSAGPEQYRAYIGASRGEFSCAKPAYVRFENAWISDRTLCYLARGKPAVVQHTGRSQFLPDAEGLFRFRSVDDAARCLAAIERDYDSQCRAARALAEEFFDARRVAAAVLERALA
jgi:hypothetical protein